MSCQSPATRWKGADQAPSFNLDAEGGAEYASGGVVTMVTIESNGWATTNDVTPCTSYK